MRCVFEDSDIETIFLVQAETHCDHGTNIETSDERKTPKVSVVTAC